MLNEKLANSRTQVVCVGPDDLSGEPDASLKTFSVCAEGDSERRMVGLAVYL